MSNPTTETLIEALARAMCVTEGGEPDAPLGMGDGSPSWKAYERLARACLPVIQAHQPDRDALLLKLYRRLRDGDDARGGWTDAGMDDAFFRWCVIERELRAALANPAAPTTDAERRKPKVHTVRTIEGSTEFHAQRDLEYIEGLQAHCDEGGKVSAKNVSDLMAMVRWNAEALLTALRASTGTAEGEDV